jgi:hypothetical protein
VTFLLARCIVTNVFVQSDLVLKGRPDGPKPDPLVIAPHESMEELLLSYAGLIRYMKEMDEKAYGKLCGVREYQLNRAK